MKIFSHFFTKAGIIWSMKQKQAFFILSLLSLALLIAPGAQAQVCAMCTVVIGSALGLSKCLGVPDLISGIWLGALVLAIASFTGNSVAKKTGRQMWRWLVLASIVAFSYLSLYLLHFFADSPTDYWGLPNLLVAMLAGTLALLVGEGLDKVLRRLKNDAGRPYFPFQKVVCPVVCLLIMTGIMYWCCLS